MMHGQTNIKLKCRCLSLRVGTRRLLGLFPLYLLDEVHYVSVPLFKLAFSETTVIT